MSAVEEPINEPKPKKVPKAKKEPKAPKPKKIVWNIPAPRAAIRSTHWARHIYTMIKEANPALLQRDDIRDAYNHLVNFLILQRDSVITYPPAAHAKYRAGIQYDTLQSFSNSRTINLLPGQYAYGAEQFRAIVSTIYDAYLPLYQLIKDEVVPYMARIVKEKEYKDKKSGYTQSLNRLLEQQMKTIKQYQSTMSYMQKQIDEYTALLANLEKEQ
jgi:hypothetical protein